MDHACAQKPEIQNGTQKDIGLWQTKLLRFHIYDTQNNVACTILIMADKVGATLLSVKRVRYEY